jgi:hypothetical protein
VTKKAMATIDLRQALAVEDDAAPARSVLSPQSASTAQTGSSGRSSRFVDELDGPGVERSFRLIFPDDAEIAFFADSDDEKAAWCVWRCGCACGTRADVMVRLHTLNQLVGNIPPNPLWAELLWQKQQEAAAVQAVPPARSPSPEA